MVADLLESGQHSQDQAQALRIAGLVQLTQTALTDALVKGGLGRHQLGVLVDNHLVRQIRRDGQVGFHAPQQKGLGDAAQLGRLGLILVAFDGLAVRAREARQAFQVAGQNKVEQAPQLGQVVLYRRAGQGQAHLAIQALDGLGTAGLVVLDVVRLVQDD